MRKYVTKSTVLFVVLTFMFSIFTALLPVQKTSALTDDVYPNGDNTTGFANTTGASHYTELDETSYSSGDYVNTGTAGSGGEIEEFDMTSAAGSTDSVTQIAVKFQAYADAGCNGGGGSNCDDLDVRIFIDGAYDGTTRNQIITASDTEYTLTWTGTWTGDDDLRVEITRNVNGSGSPGGRDDDVRIGRVYSTITYTPTPTKVVFTTAARTLTAGACSGAGNIITIQLQNASDTPTNPSGATTIRITSTSPSETIYSDSSCLTTLTNGDVSFTTAENTKSFYVVDTRKSNPTWSLTAAKQSGPDTITSANQNITVNAAAVSRLHITLPGQTFTDGTGNSGSPSAQTAGSSFNITSISATDAYNNLNTSYSGAKTLVYSGPGNAPDTTAPSYTTAVSFTAGQSTTTLTTSLFNAASSTITATDGGFYGYPSSSVTVNHAAVENYTVTEAGSSFIAGVCSSAAIQARDDWNNNATTDTSTITPTDSGSAVNFFTNGTCGSGASSYTLSGGTTTIYYTSTDKQGNFTVTVTKQSDTPTGSSGNIFVDPAAANALLIRLPGQSFTDGTGITGSPNFAGTRSPNATAGTSFTVDIKAVDQYNNLVDSGTNNYTGSKTISYADSTAGNAPDTTMPTFPSTSPVFSNGEANGLIVTYVNGATSRTFEADDTVTTVNGIASSTFTVGADVTDNYSVAPAATSQTAGSSFNVTITARDQYDNLMGALYIAPAGTYTWSTNASSAPDSTASSIGTLSQGDFTSGVATKSVTLFNAESGVTFTAQEPAAGASGISSSTVTVSPGNISAHNLDSSVSGAVTVVETSALTVTITLLDTWRNPVSGVAAANITLSGTSSPSINQPTGSTNASGQITGDLTWTADGSETVSVQISGVSLVQDDGSTADADGFLDNTHAVTVEPPPTSTGIGGGTTIRGGTTLQ